MTKVLNFFFGPLGPMVIAVGGIAVLATWFITDRYLYGARREAAGVQKERAATNERATQNVHKATSARNASRRRDARGLSRSPYIRD